MSTANAVENVVVNSAAVNAVEYTVMHSDGPSLYAIARMMLRHIGFLFVMGILSVIVFVFFMKLLGHR
ncbi:hypothetical protein ACLI4Y_10420 [Natrialbaceae archaeon A-CW3]